MVIHPSPLTKPLLHKVALAGLIVRRNPLSATIFLCSGFLGIELVHGDYELACCGFVPELPVEKLVRPAHALLDGLSASRKRGRALRSLRLDLLLLSLRNF